LFVTTNWQLILLIKNCFNLVQYASKKIKDSKYVLFLSGSCQFGHEQFCDFSINKRCRTFPEPLLLPCGRNWQLIYPKYLRCKKFYSTGLALFCRNTKVKRFIRLTVAEYFEREPRHEQPVGTAPLRDQHARRPGINFIILFSSSVVAWSY
jgi:hypothetical protein